MKREIVLYGGTFAPPHMGHLHAVRAYREAMHPDLCIVMPAHMPPHKQIDRGDDPHLRYEMACLAFSQEAGYGTSLTVSPWEIEKGGKSYTVHTLEHFASDGVHLTLLCGTDMFLSLESWYCPERIFALSRIALVRREADKALSAQIEAATARYRENYQADIVHIPCAAYELSSSRIRAAVAAGEEISEKVPDAVRAFILQHDLYKTKEGSL